MEFLDAMTDAVNTQMAHFFGTNPDVSLGEETPLLAAALQEHKRMKNAERYHEDIVAKIKELEENKAAEIAKKRDALLSWDDSLYVNSASLRSKAAQLETTAHSTISPFSGNYVSSTPVNYPPFWRPYDVNMTTYASRADLIAKAEENLKKAQLMQEQEKEKEISSAQSEYMWGSDSRAPSPIPSEYAPSHVPSEYAWGEETDYESMDWFHDPRSPIAYNRQSFNTVTRKWENVTKDGHVIIKIISPPQSEYAWGPEDEEEREEVLSEYAWSSKDDKEKCNDDDLESEYAWSDVISEYAWNSKDDEELNGDDAASEYAWGQNDAKFSSFGASVDFNKSGNIVVEMRNWEEKDKQELKMAIEQTVIGHLFKQLNKEENETAHYEIMEDDSDIESYESANEEPSDGESDSESVYEEEKEKIEEPKRETFAEVWQRVCLAKSKVYSKSCEKLNYDDEEEKKEAEETLEVEKETENKQTAVDIMEAVVEKVVEVEKKETEEKLKQLIEKQELVASTLDVDEKIKLMDEILKMMDEDWFKNL